MGKAARVSINLKRRQAKTCLLFFRLFFEKTIDNYSFFCLYINHKTALGSGGRKVRDGCR